jgi:hypothetical protein
LNILEVTGAQAAAQQMSARFCQEASGIIGKLALVPSGKNDLQALVNFIQERNF